MYLLESITNTCSHWLLSGNQYMCLSKVIYRGPFWAMLSVTAIIYSQNHIFKYHEMSSFFNTDNVLTGSYEQTAAQTVCWLAVTTWVLHASQSGTLFLCHQIRQSYPTTREPLKLSRLLIQSIRLLESITNTCSDWLLSCSQCMCLFMII